MKKTVLVFGFITLAHWGFAQTAPTVDYTKTVVAKTPAEKPAAVVSTKDVPASTVTTTGAAVTVKPGKKVDNTPFDSTQPKPSMNTTNAVRKRDDK